MLKCQPAVRATGVMERPGGMVRAGGKETKKMSAATSGKQFGSRHGLTGGGGRDGGSGGAGARTMVAPSGVERSGAGRGGARLRRKYWDSDQNLLHLKRGASAKRA
jgi:hypothetical protein